MDYNLCVVTVRLGVRNTVFLSYRLSAASVSELCMKGELCRAVHRRALL